MKSGEEMKLIKDGEVSGSGSGSESESKSESESRCENRRPAFPQPVLLIACFSISS